MTSIPFQPELLTHARGKTAIVTGGAGGIGSDTVRTLHKHGANVVVVDLSSARRRAEDLISSLDDASRVIFVAVDLLDWNGMQRLFKDTIAKFGGVDIVVANAGLMESRPFYEFQTDENGDLEEPSEAYRVIDVNLKGTMNTLQLAMFYMKSNAMDPATDSRGSIIIVASTSGYWAGGGVVSYASSKHGVIGLLRSSQRAANQLQIRISGIAPFFTPTHITGSYAKKWKERGIPANTTEGVANAIVQTAVDPSLKGNCVLVVSEQMKELEVPLSSFTAQWVGEDVFSVMLQGKELFDSLGGYPLPKARTD